jgi:proline iminopeptidase
MSGSAAQRALYAEIEPYERGRLAVGDGHELYWEQSGDPMGQPVVFLHGGPGGGFQPDHRRFHDPSAYRIVGFDQRGCGRSTPYASLEANTTWDLVADIERLRGHLGIARWQVFGGSWGSTLALAYAERFPARVSALVLRGIFMLRRSELLWFYQDGASHLFPDAWEPYVATIPTAERGDLMSAYHRRLTSPDPGVRLAAARAWSVWEAATSRLVPDAAKVADAAADAFAEAFARIECHYFVHGGFFEVDGQLLRDVGRIREASIPGVIVQGRYDVVCPLRSAWDLHAAWPESELVVVPDAGHAASEAGIVDALVRATDRLRL